MFDYKAKPFNLSEEDIKWVESTFSSMTEDEKVKQLFCMIGLDLRPEAMQGLVQGYAPGGIMVRPSPKMQINAAYEMLQKESKIPMLTAANLESGGNGLATEGTNICSPLGLSATNNVEYIKEFATIIADEADAIGCNWAFAPVVDIDMEFRNPITNTRTFGDDVDKIITYGKIFNKTLMDRNIAVSIKHFPGDGVDERDQHLVTSINSLEMDEYERTYGRIYRELIDHGANTIMPGHIFQPNIERKFHPELEDKDLLPATLSKIILKEYLRNELKFNGLIVSDATLMVGMTAIHPRKELPARCIEAGCDMFLFTKNIDEDVQSMKTGLENGLLSQNRLNEAVKRILALKASMKLHEKKANNTLVPPVEKLEIVGAKEHHEIAKKIANDSITLVKNLDNIIPLDVNKHKKILLFEQQNLSFIDAGEKNSLEEQLKNEGFEVYRQKLDVTNPMEVFAELMGSVENKKKQYDLILYVINYKNGSNNTVLRLNYDPQMFFADLPNFTKDIPTMMVSLSNPYHLFDAPFMKTYINTYSSSEVAITALVEKLVGKSEFIGKSPIDPFCGKWDTKL